MNQNQSQSEQESGLTLQDLVSILWEGKLVLVLCGFVAAALAVAYLWVTTPIYRVDAMIQVEEKKGGTSAMFGEIGEMFNVASPAETEIEIIKSRMVLGKVVEDLKLDIVAQPKVLPLIGRALLRRQQMPPRIVVDRFEVPPGLEGKTFVMSTQANGKFTLRLERIPVFQGQVGTLTKGAWGTDSIRIFVRELQAPTGQQFLVARMPKLSAIDQLNMNLSAMEKGKKTGILALSLQGSDVALTTRTLNAIAQGYVQQNVDRKSAEAEKTLEFLRGQLPDLKAKSDTAEGRLNQYRLQVGSIDLNAESKLILDQGVDLESKMLLMQQQKAELLRLYKEDHPNVKTLDAQIARLHEGMGSVTSQVRRLPKTQQEILRLAQEAKVAAELYNTMLNNAQQLEVAKAGQVGNVRVIDNAIPTYLPVKPKKAVTFVLLCMLGLFVGAGLLLLRRFWSTGVKDPKVLESRFGLPVFAAIPHSTLQLRVTEALRRKDHGTKLLCARDSSELSIEAFRSLRTTLHFSMHDSRNNILLLTGPSPGIGKSFVTANLAYVLAQAGRKVCLVDADMRRGAVHEYFDMVREPGLSDYLSGKAELDFILRPTGIDNLTLVSTGLVPPNPSELLLGARAESLMEALSGKFDIVLLDSPPLLAVSDAMVLAKFAGSTLLVLKHGAHHTDEIEQTITRLDHAGVKVKGCVFNNITTSGKGRTYGGGYVYQYGYGKK